MEDKKVIIRGVIKEHLKLNQKEWFEIELEDKTKIILNKKLVEVIND